MKRLIAVNLVLVALIVCLAVWWPANWLWIHTGTGNEPGSYYGFFSGFGSDLGEYVIIVGVATGIYHVARRNNCHTHGCWRIARLPVGDYRVCKRHHWEVTGSKVDIEHLKVHHHLARRKRLLDAGYKTSDGTDSQGRNWSP